MAFELLASGRLSISGTSVPSDESEPGWIILVTSGSGKRLFVETGSYTVA